MATTSVTTSTSVRPKERQFQVVPVPAVFTRGRWECIDYKDGGAGPNGSVNFTLGPAAPEQTIEFDKSANNAANSATPTPLGTQAGGMNGNGTVQEQQQQTNAQNVSEPLTPIAAPAQQPPQASNGAAALPANSSVPHFEISPSHSVPTTLTDIVVAQPCISSADSSIVTNGSGNTSTTAATPAPPNAAPPICGGAGSNAVAIDNKIEQAMDLVKTHLTFAVREEVEILRSTITDLESKVSLLENENQILRQFAPADVVATLPALVQAAQQQQQKIAAAAVAAQQQKTFQTVPSAPVIMDPHLLQQQHPPQQSQTAPPAAQTQVPKQQQQKPPVTPAQQQQQSPSPGPSGDEML